MNKGHSICDLAPGTVFADAVFQVRTATRGTERQPKLKLLLADGTGNITGTIWSVDDTLMNEIVSGKTKYVVVSGEVQRGKYAGDIQIGSLAAAPEPTDLSPFLPDFAPDHEQFVRRFNALANGIGFAPLFAVLKTLFKPIRQTFNEAFAAQTRHHAFRGGLLRHTVEVAESCERMCAVYPGLRHDLMITAALLHDFGKLTELDDCGQYTEAGRLIGHIPDGMYQVRRACDETPGMTPGLTQELVHLILSHHGTLEWGSPVTPATPEAHTLAHCDDLSAKLGHHREQAARLTQVGSRFFHVGGETIYVSDAETLALDLSGKKVTVQNAGNDPFDDVPPTGTVRLPLMGWVAAGSAGQGSFEVPDEWRDVILPPGGADFLLHVVGDSMIGIGIMERDLLFVRKLTDAPRVGQIVVASLPDGAGGVVKRFDFDAATGAPCLVSENAEYAAIPVTEAVRIQGRVVHLEREMG